MYLKITKGLMLNIYIYIYMFWTLTGARCATRAIVQHSCVWEHLTCIKETQQPPAQLPVVRDVHILQAHTATHAHLFCLCHGGSFPSSDIVLPLIIGQITCWQVLWCLPLTKPSLLRSLDLEILLYLCWFVTDFLPLSFPDFFLVETSKILSWVHRNTGRHRLLKPNLFPELKKIKIPLQTKALMPLQKINVKLNQKDASDHTSRNKNH